MKVPPRMQDGHFGLSGPPFTGYLDGMAEPSYLSKPCPLCGKPAVERFRPFCSGRCKDIDLNRWMKGVYAIPAVESEDDSEQERDVPSNLPRDKEGR